MSPETLLRQVEVMADAPNGVQKLRELVLQLAVRGKLVPQDPNDEPAGVLLGRIAAEKKRLFKEGKISTPKPLPAVDDVEVPYQAPAGWAWARLAELGDFCGGSTPSKSKASFWGGRVPWVSPKDMKTDLIIASEDTITEQALRETRLRLIPPKSILIVTRSGILRRMLPVGISQMPCTVNQDLKVLIPHIAGMDEYLRILLKGHETLILRDLVKGGMTVQSVVFDEFERYPFPIPPLPEQRRIVAKIDELMALCDELESRQQRRAAARARLNRSALHHLTAATDDAELAAHWQRLQENFHLLYDTPETVAELRQAVLQLAVRGKLVPQDSNDESAGVLLERIAAEKQRLFEEGRISKPKPLPPIREDEVPFEVPEGWEWARLGEYCRFIDYRGKTPPKTKNGVRLITAKNVRMGYIREEPEEFISETTYEKWMTRGFPQAGDILFTTEAPLANVAQIDTGQKVALAQRVINLHPFLNKTPGWLVTALRSPGIQQVIFAKATGTTATGIKSSRLQLVPVPIPPPQEQRRIMSKVDELMVLCDQLEARLTAAREKSEHLTASVVHHLAAA